MYFLNLFSYPFYEVGAVIAPILPGGEEGGVRGDGGEGCSEGIQSRVCGWGIIEPGFEFLWAKDSSLKHLLAAFLRSRKSFFIFFHSNYKDSGIKEKIDYSKLDWYKLEMV